MVRLLPAASVVWQFSTVLDHVYGLLHTGVGDQLVWPLGNECNGDVTPIDRSPCPKLVRRYNCERDELLQTAGWLLKKPARLLSC